MSLCQALFYSCYLKVLARHSSFASTCGDCSECVGKFRTVSHASSSTDAFGPENSVSISMLNAADSNERNLDEALLASNRHMEVI
jgi:hypothetical protein